VHPVKSGDPARSELDRRILEWMGEREAREDEARFEELALRLFAHQFSRCQPYARFCRARGATPETVSSWREIPAVPAGAFKEAPLRSFPPELERHVFRTSGTSTRRRGELHLDTLALYEASLIPSFERHVLPDLGEPALRILILAPSPREVPDSSLSHMFGVILERRGDRESGFLMQAGELQSLRLLEALEKARASDAPVVLCGTAFALLHFLEGLESEERRIALPEGSRVMETGGFKGRSRELPQDLLYENLHRSLGVPPERIVNQYGMTELGSQFYDSVLRLPGTPRRKLGPPWARVRLVDPESGREAPPGEIGAVTVLDLANTGSILAIQTADLGRAVLDGFEVLGREPGAEARGCSIAADEMLEAHASSEPQENEDGRLP
jgi:hypothetical protein